MSRGVDRAWSQADPGVVATTLIGGDVDAEGSKCVVETAERVGEVRRVGCDDRARRAMD